MQEHKKIKIAFIYPSMSESGFGSSGRGKMFSHIHPGLCYLSAVCKKAGFTDISLVDLRALEGWDAFMDRMRSAKPDVAAITMMTPDYMDASRCIDIIKEASPNTKIVVGGYHPLIMTDELIKNTKIDHIVVGEGEVALPGLLEKIASGLSAEKVIKGSGAEVDELPFIDRELFDCLESPHDFFLPPPFMTVLAGRGCPYNCNFCAPASKMMHGYKTRRRSVESVMKELEYLRDTYNFKSLRFLDDCFANDKKWTMEFCRQYRSRAFRQPFVCQMRADIICKNPDMMRALKKCGLAMVCVGFESGSERILKFVNKGTTVEQNIKAAQICRRLGIKVWAYVMLGLPTETNEDADATLRMIKKIRPYRADVAFFTPRPGSYFYDFCKKNSISLIGDHDDYVVLPETDRPRIKGIDYAHMKDIAVKMKKDPLSMKIYKRLERVLSHKVQKSFRLKFAEEMARYPELGKMAVLRTAHAEGRL